MYSSYSTKARQEAIAKASHSLRMINNAPIIFDDETADAFMLGVKQIRNFTKDEIEKISKMSVEEVNTSWTGDNESQVKAAISLMAKALRMGNDAILGTPARNLAITAGVKDQEKSFHAAGNVDMGKAVLELSALNSAYSRPEVDAGWMTLYNMVDARGRNEIRVSDVIGHLRWYELGKHEEILLTAIGSSTGDTIGMRRFGGGFMFDSYDMKNNLYNANNILAWLRNASSDLKAVIAYRELCIDQTGGLSYSASTEFTGTAGTRDGEWARANNNIHALNEAAKAMINNALQLGSGKKANKESEAKLPVTANTPIVVLYNHAHGEEIARMQRMIGGDDGINSNLLYNFQFQMSHLVPVSGGYTASASADRDEWGIYGKVTESATKGGFGVRMVIPGLRNIFVMYEDLSFGSDARWTTSSTVVGGYERYNFVVDTRQTAKVTLTGL